MFDQTSTLLITHPLFPVPNYLADDEKPCQEFVTKYFESAISKELENLDWSSIHMRQSPRGVDSLP